MIYQLNSWLLVQKQILVIEKSSQIKCMKCLHKSERTELMMDLTVEIGGDIGSLEEALTQFTSYEVLDGDNRYLCDRYKLEHVFLRTKYIYTGIIKSKHVFWKPNIYIYLKTSTSKLIAFYFLQPHRCKSYQKAKKKLMILEGPNILTVVLKRFQVRESL